MLKTKTCAVWLAAVCAMPASWAATAGEARTPGEILAAYTVQAGAGGSPQRGRSLYAALQKGPACPPNHAASAAQRPACAQQASVALPLSRFSVAERWFTGHCQPVLGRSCTAQEKVDMVAWKMKTQR